MTIPTNSVVVWGFHWRRFIPLHVLWLILNSYSSARNRRQPQGACWVCSAHERFASVGGHPVPTFPVPSWRGPLSPHLAEWVSLTRSWEHGKRASWSLGLEKGLCLYRMRYGAGITLISHMFQFPWEDWGLVASTPGGQMTQRTPVGSQAPRKSSPAQSHLHLPAPL